MIENVQNRKFFKDVKDVMKREASEKPGQRQPRGPMKSIFCSTDLQEISDKIFDKTNKAPKMVQLMLEVTKALNKPIKSNLKTPSNSSPSKKHEY